MAGKALRTLSHKQKLFTAGGAGTAGMSGLYLAGRGNSAEDSGGDAKQRQRSRNMAAGAIGGAGAGAAALTYGGARAQREITRGWGGVRRTKGIRTALSRHKDAYREKTGIDYNKTPGKVGTDFYTSYPLRTASGERIPYARARRALAWKNKPAVLAASIGTTAAGGALLADRIGKSEGRSARRPLTPDEQRRLERLTRNYQQFKDSSAPLAASVGGGAYLGGKFARGATSMIRSRMLDENRPDPARRRTSVILRDPYPMGNREVNQYFDDAARWRRHGAAEKMRARVGRAGAVAGAGLGAGLYASAQLRRRSRERAAG